MSSGGSPARLLALVLALPSMLSCGSSNEPEAARVIGTIEFFDEPVVVEVPDTATMGQPLSVMVATYGYGCARKGETKVDVDGLRAEVVPYDTVILRPVVCPGVLKRFEHRTDIQFGQPGIAEVEIRGRSNRTAEVLSIERSVLVREPQ